MDYKTNENELVPIHEGEEKERLVNVRELHTSLESKQEFANRIKNTIKNTNF